MKAGKRICQHCRNIKFVTAAIGICLLVGSFVLETNSLGHQFVSMSTTTPTLATDPKKYYLLYFVQGGWSNQVQCLEHAYYVARVTRRILVTSPMVPHKVLNHRSNTRLVDDPLYLHRRTFLLDFDLEKTFQSHYTPMSRILDVQYSLPHLVGTMDFADFIKSSTIDKNNTWVMEQEMSHYTTEWVVGGSDEDHDKIRRVNMTEYSTEFQNLPIVQRDLARYKVPSSTHDESFPNPQQPTTLDPHSGSPVWIFLDSYISSFRSEYPLEILEYERQRGMLAAKDQVLFRPRFQPWIQRLAQTIIEAKFLQQQTNFLLPYAAIHIRGSDGFFSKNEFIRTAIISATQDITQQLLDWTQRHAQIRQVGLVVVSDIKNIAEKQAMVLQQSILEESLWRERNVSVSFVYTPHLYRQDNPDFAQYCQELTDQARVWGVATSDAKLLVEQQLAACATIGFAGTTKSTFSALIARMRREYQRSTGSRSGHDEEEDGGNDRDLDYCFGHKSY